MTNREFIQHILDSTKYNGSNIKNSLSASSIAKPTCINWLKQTYGVIEDEDFGANTLGSVGHLGLEHIFKDKFETEHSMERKLGDYTITGTADLIADNCIYDYKFVKKYSHKKWLEDPEKNDYTIQLNVLRWLTGKDMDMKIVWFIKDPVKTKNEADYYITDVPVLDIEPVIQKAVNDLKSVLGVPEPCEDRWTRKLKNGKTYFARCKDYCSYNKVCPHYKPELEIPIF